MGRSPGARTRTWGTRCAAFAAVLTLVLAGTESAGLSPLVKPGSTSPLLRQVTDLGREPATEQHHVVVGLELRNREALEAFLVDLHDPGSPRYRHFLSQDEFNALYAPTESAEEAVVTHLTTHGLRVTDRFPNRLVVGAVGSTEAIDEAFGVEIHAVDFLGRRHYAAVNEPSLPAALADIVVGVTGLDDLVERRPHVRATGPVPGPRASLGSNCCHLSPNDLAAFYGGTMPYDGTGQTIVIAGVFAWQDSDNTTFNLQWGLPQLAAGSGQVCTGSSHSAGCKFSKQNSIEIALDTEYSHGTAPGAAILNYMAASTGNADFTQMYDRIVTDNPGHVVSTSWGVCEAGLPSATQQTDDAIFANANAIGQSWFAASGDNGSLDCNGILTVDNPANSPHVIGVGGTSPTCSSGLTPQSPACAGYGSETAWSASGGGISEVFSRPAFQVGCGIPAGTQRLVPDVALEADTSPGEYVLEGGSWFAVGGTSGAAPQWAGFFAALDQKAGGGLGNPGHLLYGLCGTTAYHDIVAGSNGNYSAGAGYDLVTGLGTISASDFLALATTRTTSTIPTTTSASSTSTSTSSTTTTTRTSSTTTRPPTTTTTTSSTTTTQVPTTITTSTSTTTTQPPTTTTTSSSTTTTQVPTTITTSTSTTQPPTTTTTTSTTTTTIAAIPCGDVNGDGVVNIGDALLVAQFDVGLRQCGVAPFSHPAVCDVNQDGACNIGDALRMAQCDVGLISCAFTCTPFVCP